ncbi:MAG: 30S ribosomal protein S17e [archaeon]
MGKAVPKNIKSKANTLMSTYPDKVSKDFEANKVFIDSFKMPLSKEERNLVAGFIARTKAKASSA